MLRVGVLLALLFLLIAPPANAQLRPNCPGSELSYDPTTQQIGYVWEAVIRFPSPPDATGPTAVALDSSCNLYIADSTYHRIVKVAPTGETLAQWGAKGRGTGQFMSPQGVAVDRSGNIYVADSGNWRVVKLSPNGEVRAMWGKCLEHLSPCQPTGGQGPREFLGLFAVAVDDAGNVYTTETENDRIQKLSPDGAPLAAWGSHGQGPGQFDQPMGISLDAAGNVYVVDAINNRVQKLSPGGAPLFQFAVPAAGPDVPMQHPRGVAVDSQGSVYVSDWLNDRIVRFATDGSLSGQWCRSAYDPCQLTYAGDRPGEFSFPASMAVDGQGTVYLADTGNNRVQRLRRIAIPLPLQTPDNASSP